MACIIKEPTPPTPVVVAACTSSPATPIIETLVETKVEASAPATPSAASSVTSPSVAAAAATPSTPSADYKHNARVVMRLSAERGHENHGWLNTYYSFSFASYYEHEFTNFHSLRVINEDRVAGGKGFPEHGHANAEIFTYLIRGQIAHKDSMGHEETISRGGVQFTSAGKGIKHSEYNASKTKMLHLLQIWVTPTSNGLKPNYQTVVWDEKEKEGKLALIVAPVGTDAVVHGKHVIINQDMKMYASILRPTDGAVSYTIGAGRVGYIHVVQDPNGMTAELNKTGITVNGEYKFGGGDGAFVTPNNAAMPITLSFACTGTTAEFVVFDMKPSKPLKKKR